MRSSLKMAFIAAASFSAALMSSNAHALDVGKCYALEELNPAMRGEGQHSLIVVNESLRSQTGYQDVARVITSDDNGVGYILNSDKPAGQRASKMCVDAKLINVNLFNSRATTLNNETLIAGNPKIAEDQCKVISDHYCGYHNDVVATAFKNGVNVIAQANMIKNSTRSDTNSLLTFFSDVKPSDIGNGITSINGSMTVSTQAGASVLTAAYKNVEYTDYARARLATRAKTAEAQAPTIR